MPKARRNARQWKMCSHHMCGSEQLCNAAQATKELVKRGCRIGSRCVVAGRLKDGSDKRKPVLVNDWAAPLTSSALVFALRIHTPAQFVGLIAIMSV